MAKSVKSAKKASAKTGATPVKATATMTKSVAALTKWLSTLGPNDLKKLERVRKVARKGAVCERIPDPPPFPVPPGVTKPKSKKTKG